MGPIPWLLGFRIWGTLLGGSCDLVSRVLGTSTGVIIIIISIVYCIYNLSY